MGFFPFAPSSGGITLPVSIANGGTGQAAAAAAYNALSPMTTTGDMEYDSAGGTAARLPIGTAGQMLGMAAGIPAWAAGLTLLATTGAAGYTLVNGTGNILTWTAPSDGALHRVLTFANKHVSSAETGGQVQITVTLPDGTPGTGQLFAGSQGTGWQTASGVALWAFIQAGSTVTIKQSTALTAGTSVLWAELWGS